MQCFGTAAQEGDASANADASPSCFLFLLQPIQFLCDLIYDVLYKGANQTDACCVIYLFCGTSHGDGKSPLLKLLLHAVGTFDSGLKGDHRIPLPQAHPITADHAYAGEKFRDGPFR